MADRSAPQERTVLAWRRTGLALVVGALTIGRLGLDHLGSAVVGPTLVAAAIAGWVLAAAVRERRVVRDPTGGADFSVLASGRLPAVVAGLVAVLAAGELLTALAPLVGHAG